MSISRTKADLFGSHHDLLRHPPSVGEHHRRRRQTSLVCPVHLLWSHDRNVVYLVRARGHLEVPGTLLHSLTFLFFGMCVSLVPRRPGKSSYQDACGSMDQIGRALCPHVWRRSCLEGEPSWVLQGCHRTCQARSVVVSCRQTFFLPQVLVITVPVIKKSHFHRDSCLPPVSTVFAFRARCTDDFDILLSTSPRATMDYLLTGIRGCSGRKTSKAASNMEICRCTLTSRPSLRLGRRWDGQATGQCPICRCKKRCAFDVYW